MSSYSSIHRPFHLTLYHYNFSERNWAFCTLTKRKRTFGVEMCLIRWQNRITDSNLDISYLRRMSPTANGAARSDECVQKLLSVYRMQLQAIIRRFVLAADHCRSTVYAKPYLLLSDLKRSSYIFLADKFLRFLSAVANSMKPRRKGTKKKQRQNLMKQNIPRCLPLISQYIKLIKSKLTQINGHTAYVNSWMLLYRACM